MNTEILGFAMIAAAGGIGLLACRYCDPSNPHACRRWRRLCRTIHRIMESEVER